MRVSLPIRLTLGILLLTVITGRPGFSHQVSDDNLVSNSTGYGKVTVTAKTSPYSVFFPNTVITLTGTNTGYLDAYGPFGGGVMATNVNYDLFYDGNTVQGDTFTLYAVPYSSPWDYQQVTPSGSRTVTSGAHSVESYTLNTESTGPEATDTHSVSVLGEI